MMYLKQISIGASDLESHPPITALVSNQLIVLHYTHVTHHSHAIIVYWCAWIGPST